MSRFDHTVNRAFGPPTVSRRPVCPGRRPSWARHTPAVTVAAFGKPVMILVQLEVPGRPSIRARLTVPMQIPGRALPGVTLVT